MQFKPIPKKEVVPLERAHAQNPHWWIIKVLPEDAIRIEKEGVARNNHGKAMGWTSKTKDDSHAWNIAGRAGEWATGMVYNVPIVKVLAHTGEDLAAGDACNGFIEVRTSTGGQPWLWDLLCAKSECRPERAYVQCLSAWWPYWMVVTGWAWGHEVLASQAMIDARHRSEKLYSLERRYLRDPNTLVDVIRERAI